MSKSKQYRWMGELKTIKEWSEDPRCVVSAKKLSDRLRLGWTMTRAMTEPVNELQATRRRRAHET